MTQKKMALIATKGTLDWAYPPFILASTAGALGYEVQIFFTFYGLQLLKKDLSDVKISPLANLRDDRIYLFSGIYDSIVPNGVMATVFRFYADPDNQTPQGPARRRRSNLSEPVPVRFPPETLAKIRDAADADDRSVSSWIRRAVDHELEHDTKTA